MTEDIQERLGRLETLDGLAVDANALSAAAGPDVDDGPTSVTDAEALTPGSGLTVTDDGTTALVGEPPTDFETSLGAIETRPHRNREGSA